MANITPRAERFVFLQLHRLRSLGAKEHTDHEPVSGPKALNQLKAELVGSALQKLLWAQ